ncbi:MAG: 4-oxalocrotonate tautomerase family protein [Alphaproteobacteria bacterium]|nr:4-oxalocrotonate tautomerase family protein [Alphaproteobacteria bacterium]
MPIIRIEMFEGRDREQKRQIIKEVTDGFSRATGASPDTVHVVLTDVSTEDWGRGGEAFADKT